MGWGTHVQLLTIQMVTSSDSPDPDTLHILPRLANFYYMFVLCIVLMRRIYIKYKNIPNVIL